MNKRASPRLKEQDNMNQKAGSQGHEINELPGLYSHIHALSEVETDPAKESARETIGWFLRRDGRFPRDFRETFNCV